MKIKLVSTEEAYIEINGYTIHIDASIPSKPPIVSCRGENLDDELKSGRIRDLKQLKQNT
jgi:hypothetical protein